MVYAATLKKLTLPDIHLQILHTDLYTFPFRISWENLMKDQSIFPEVILLLQSNQVKRTPKIPLMTLLFEGWIRW